MLNQWYSEGLILPDFVSLAWYSDAFSLHAQDVLSAVEITMTNFLPMFSAMNTSGAEMVPVSLPCQTEDQFGNLHFRRYNFIIGDNCSFITTAARDRGVDVLCAQWLDYRYSEEGRNIVNYGQEGLSWELGEDGYPHYTEYVTNDPTYTSGEMRDMSMFNSGGSYYMWEFSYDFGDYIFDAYSTWTSASLGDWVMPNVTLNTEEAELYSTTYGDISTYVSEMIPRFILGDVPMTEWDSFVDNIESMRIQDCIDVYQSALDRYLAR